MRAIDRRVAMRTGMAIALLAACTACGDGSPTDPGFACTAIAVPALQVTVVDGATGALVCDAVVVASEGSYSQALEAFGNGGADCSYSGPWERAGVYTVTATHPTLGTATRSGVRVTADECHVQTQRLQLTLVR